MQERTAHQRVRYHGDSPFSLIDAKPGQFRCLRAQLGYCFGVDQPIPAIPRQEAHVVQWSRQLLADDPIGPADGFQDLLRPTAHKLNVGMPEAFGTDDIEHDRTVVSSKKEIGDVAM